MLPDGRVVFSPFGSTSILVAAHASWHPDVLQMQPEEKNLAAMHRMWANRDFADATIEAGEPGKSLKAIPVHRAVLATVNDVFRAMFMSSFCEGLEHRIRFPEEPEAVEAILEYLYTGSFRCVFMEIFLVP